MILYFGLVSFVLFISTLTAIEYPCTYKSSQGDFYDLSPLSKCDLSGYSSQDGAFTLNICNNVKVCRNSTSVCQSGTYDCGHAFNSTFSDYSGSSKGVVLTYGSGATCPNGASRKSIITFLCDNSLPTDPQVSFVSENPTCTYNFAIRTKEACPKSEAPQIENCKVNVFLVPNTHDDVGWLETIEGYYNNHVKNILDSTVAALQENPQRTFIWVEQAFFYLWWTDTNTSDQQRNAVKTFVSQGRWEFVIGAWTMPDEACTTYGALVDQLTIGHQFLLNTFGAIPTKGWQIDPFGATSTTAVIEKLAGFDAHLIDRVTDKQLIATSQQLEFLWQGSPSLGKKGEIFTEIMPPVQYCDWYFKFDFHNDPVTPGNVAQYGQTFINMVEERSLFYKTPNLLASWGCDFSHQNARNDFNSMDKVIGWLQTNTNKITVNYTTLSEYYNSVWKSAEELGTVWPLNDSGDYMPLLYGGKWWTGYFTSRSQLKGYVREGEAASHTAEPLFSLGRSFSLPIDFNKAYNQLFELRVANAYSQHHDGVTGTSVPEVVQMYEDYLINGIQSAFEASSDILNMFIKKPNSPQPHLQRITDPITNIRPGQTGVVLLFNGLGWTRQDVVSIPVNNANLIVMDSNGSKIEAQISPTMAPNVTSTYELFFIAKVGPLGFATYFVFAPTSDAPILREITHVTETFKPETLADTVLENSVLQVTVSETTGLISHITNKKTGVSLNVEQNLHAYTSSSSSGAYAFVPNGASRPLSSGPPKITITQGPIVSEIQQVFSNIAKQTIRLSNANGNEDVEEFLDIHFDIGPLPSHTELVSLFTTPIITHRTVTTDDNGYELLPRAYNAQVGIEANYYPMVYSASINNAHTQLTLISGRSHGIGCPANGQVEVMIHRNPDSGDGFGPGLTDTSKVFPKLRVIVDSPTESIESIHRQPYLMNFPLTLFSDLTNSASDWINNYVTQYNFLKADLPSNIHLLSLNALEAPSKSVILRLTHVYTTDEDPEKSKPVTIDLTQLFSKVTISSVKETTLTANKDLNSPSFTVVIGPKEIRTFVVNLVLNDNLYKTTGL